MKSIKSLLAGAAMLTAVFTASAAEKVEIQFLPYYDSLNAVLGKPGHWFIRDAAGTTTGAHGDPTVQKGWAIYTWNTSCSGTRRPGWTKICEEESLDGTAAEQLALKYVTKVELAQIMNSVSNDFVKVSKYNQDMAGVVSSITTLDTKTTKLDAKVTELGNSISAIDAKATEASTKATTAIEGLATHEEWAKSMSNNVLTAANKYSDASRNALYQWILNTLVPFIRASDARILATSYAYTDAVAKGYTAWEVWPHASDDNLTERFYIRTSVASNCTITCSDGTITLALPTTGNRCYIDWGDGSKTYLKDLPDFSTMTTNEVLKIYEQREWIPSQDWVLYVAVEHTYASSDEKKYIIKVGGLDFFCVYKSTLRSDYPMNSMTSRVFDPDLPIAANQNNVIFFGGKSPYLTKVHFPHRFDAPWVKNWSCVFRDCKNLKEVLNMDCICRNARNVGGIFQDCTALTNTDFRINGNNIYAPSAIFSGCINLEVDLYKLLPNNGFADQLIDINSCFKNCKKLYIGAANSNKVAQILWMNNLIQWTPTSCFTGCSEGLRAFVPKTWGGTGNDIISSIAKGATVINNYPTYPNRVNGAFNVAFGIDNEVGFGSNDSSYSVAVGTSNKAAKMHSYAWGSQLNALEANSTVIGYGLSATDQYSVVIGQASRTICDRSFSNVAAMTAFLSDPACTNEIFVGYGILCDNGPGCSHIIDTVLKEPDPDTGMYAVVRSGPYDIEVGKRRWYYGKSHGRGTVNLAAIGDGKKDLGLANVYINDRSLSDWTGIHIGEVTYKRQYNKGITNTITKCDADYTIAIGDNARATETYSVCQSIAIGRDALSSGSATVAVGPNSFACGSLAVALGWRANAVGDRSIAIGAAKTSGQDYYVDGVVNTNADLCAAVGANSIAIGFNAKALGAGSAQIGTGTNSTPNTLKFQNVTLVENGQLVGSFDPKELDPKVQDISTNTTEYVDEMIIKVKPHIINTIVSSKMVDAGSELYLEPEGSRNYKLFIPNDPNMRNGLPITIETEIDNNPTVLFLEGTKTLFTLPAMVEVQQPISNNIVFTSKSMDDGWCWTPGITNCNIVCTNVTSTAKFVTQGSYSILGTNLHAGVTYQIVYPTSATATSTNDLMTASVKEKFIVDTLYYGVSSVDFTPSTPIYFSGDTSWFEIIYKTNHGDANVIHKTISLTD